MAKECRELTEHKKFLRAVRDDFAKRAAKALQEAREHKRNKRFLEALKADSRAREYRATRDRYAGKLREASFPVNASEARIHERDRAMAEIAHERGLHLDDDADVIFEIYAERSIEVEAEKNLHERLADFGITSKPGTIPGKRTLIQYGQEIGQFDAHEGWRLVRDLSGSPVCADSPSAA